MKIIGKVVEGETIGNRTVKGIVVAVTAMANDRGWLRPAFVVCQGNGRIENIFTSGASIVDGITVDGITYDIVEKPIKLNPDDERLTTRVGRLEMLGYKYIKWCYAEYNNTVYHGELFKTPSGNLFVLHQALDSNDLQPSSLETCIGSYLAKTAFDKNIQSMWTNRYGGTFNRG